MKVLTLSVAESEGEGRLDRFVRRRFPHLTQGQIEKLCRTGQIRVDGARAKASDRIAPGQSVRLPPIPAPGEGPPRSKLSPKDEAFVRSLVIHKDDEVIAIAKPAGLAVQGGTKTVRHLDALLEGLKFEKDGKPKLVHRLDRDTSGVMVLGRTPRAAAALSEAFKTRQVNKIYWAIVLGSPRPPFGQVRCWMRKAPGAREGDQESMIRCAQADEGAVHGITDYALIAEAGHRAAWMALRPVTGRTHQLRFHMAELGHAILGDRKYTCDRPTPGGLSELLHLHARALDVPHPVKGRLRLVAPLPAHMEKTFDALGFDERDAKDPFAAFAD